MRSILNYHHSYTFVFIFFIFFLFPAFSISLNTFSATESLTISSNKTILSPSGIFELGFFNPASSSRWYLGIWYKKISTRTYVWVANRDNPLTNSNGTLKISDNNLIIWDQSDTAVWSTNLTSGDVKSPVVVELLDNGNFVLRVRDANNKDPGEFLWQSFDYPTDTLLPEMKLGWDNKTGINRFLRSWKTPDDPASGDFSTILKTKGFSEFYVSNKESILYRSGPWNGIGFSSVPEMKPVDYLVYSFTANNEEVTYSYRITNTNIYSRLSLNSAGLLQRLTWIETAKSWKQLWYSPKDLCDNYKECGSFGYCDPNTSPICNCIKGFEARNEQMWALRDDSAGCVRKTRLRCDGRDGFVRLKNTKLPDTTATTVNRGIGLKECEERCLKACNCTAYANADIRNGGSGCVIWTGEILDIRNYAKGGQDLYVKVAASDLEDKRIKNGKIIGWSVGVSILILLGFIIFCFWNRKQKRSITIHQPPIVRSSDSLMKEVVISSRRYISTEDKTEDLELPLMEFEAVSMATNNFSNTNKLGTGGFGTVYKGRLLDGKEIAVKRLSKMSSQGTDEFKNEVKLIARLQHINLVRLLGCCIDKGEKMLIYEYLENLSLDSHLFDKTRRANLTWPKRLDITNGIARGLLYLHQDSRFRIIHRDLKVSNVLLDKNMTPKISDFGMARIFGRDEIEANTRKVVGTYGYMSPEYAMYGIFSMKSDVFSFGVLLLEIISGKKNNGFYNSNRDQSLLGFVWRNWKEGKGLEIVDPIIRDSSSSTFPTHEIIRCIQIGLLCVQERAEDRPVMSSVMVMLGSETTAIPQPKRPGFCVGKSLLETDSSSSTQRDDEQTVNQITLSVIEARETYRYFDLPYCSSAPIEEKKEALGEVLNGDRLVTAPYKLKFLGNKDSVVACEKKLSREEVAKFRDAISKDYFFQMYYDDLPIFGFLGKIDMDAYADPSTYRYYLYNHLNFEVFYNVDRVIEINLRQDPNSLVDVTKDKDVEVSFRYTVKWKEVEVPFYKMMDRYTWTSTMHHTLDNNWFSTMNLCLTVLLVTGLLVTFFVRILKNDFAKYTLDEEATDENEETGWKLIHGDVFRFPKHNSLLAAALGFGIQLFTIAFLIFMLALFGVFYPYNRGTMLTALVVIYALTSGIAGYTSASFYCQLQGTNWVRNIFLTGSLFFGPLLITFSFLNTVATAYQATVALPIGTIFIVFLIWVLVSTPLLILRTIAGKKNSNGDFQAPCQTTQHPKEIPQQYWYRRTFPQMAMAGLLPFTAIYIELFYVFASVWGHRVYTLYTTLFIVFIILVIVTAFITVALTYLQLASEDHEWWWRSFLCGRSTGLLMYAFCFYYYYVRTDMSGLLQVSFFFGYMTCISYGFFLMLGTIGFGASLLFVRHIYISIKCE